MADLKIEHIDFDFINNTNNVKTLKKALKILQEDGSFYQELEHELKDKICKLDPKFQDIINRNQPVDDNLKQEAEKDIHNWVDQVQSEQNTKSSKDNKQIFEEKNNDLKTITQKEQQLTQKEKIKLAESEKQKGNEALLAQDMQEALAYYEKALKLDPTLDTAYCNSALIYLKQKNFQKTIEFCNQAIQYNEKYIKAFHRRGQAYLSLKQYINAVKDFQTVMKLDPNNKEANGLLKEARDKLNSKELQQLEQEQENQNFKRIEIEEDNDDDDEEEEENNQKNEEVKNTEQQTKVTTDKKEEKIVEEKIKIQEIQQTQKVQVPQKEQQQYDKQQQVIANLKQQGLKLINDGMFPNAIKIFEECIKSLTKMVTQYEKYSDLKMEVLQQIGAMQNNIALCYLQFQEYKKVLEYTNKIIEKKQNYSKDLLIKAYLRQALAYESIEKVIQALVNFKQVKTLDPSNQQAQQGFHRIVSHLSQKEIDDANKIFDREKIDINQFASNNYKSDFINSPVQNDTNQKISSQQVDPIKEKTKIYEIQQEKEKGNALFKANKIADADKIFQAQIKEMEKFLNKQNQDKQIIELYCQLLNNSSLCNFNLANYGIVIENCKKVLDYDENSSKAYYRRALTNIALSNNIKKNELEDKKKKKSFLFEAREDLEKLLKFDTKNQMATNKLNETISQLQTINQQIIQEENQKKDQLTDKSQTLQQQQNQPKKKMNQKDLSEVIKNVAKSAMDELIQGNDQPTTSLNFENNVNTFKNNLDRLFHYLKKLPADIYENLYKKKDIPTEQFLKIIETIKQTGIKEDPTYSFKILNSISKTYNFHLAVMCMTKQEKKNIVELLEKIQLPQNHQEQNQKLMKLFK